MALGIGQVAKGTTTGSTSVTTASVNTNASGSSFFLLMNTRLSSPFSSIGDNKGNTYTIVGAQLDNGTNYSRVYKCENASGGTGHTFNVSISPSAEITLLAIEITSGSAATVDKTASQADSATPFTSGSTATTSTANEIILGLIGSDGNTNPSTFGISGSTPAAGSWTIQVKEEDGTTLWTAAIASASVSSTGTYEAGFTDASASGCMVWVVTVQEAGPSISSQPTNQTVYENQVATFTISATGTGTLHYQWKDDGSNVGTDSSTYAPTTTLAMNGSLITCTVTDDNGSSTSNTVYLNVLPSSSIAWIRT